MTDDPRLREIEEVLGAVDVDESRLADLVLAMGSDANGLRLLVDRYGPSSDPRAHGYVALALAEAGWNLGPANTDIETIVYDFIETVRHAEHSGTLVSTLNALQGLDANRTLRFRGSSQRARVLTEFLVRCVESRDEIVRAAALDVLGHLWQSRSLPKLLPGASSAPLRASLARLAAHEAADDLKDDLVFLRDFWRSE